MRRLRFPVYVVILMILTSSMMVSAMEIFPLEDVQPGLVGIGKTVIRGTQIEDFTVEVLGTIPQSPPINNLIMVRVSGDVIEQTGGIAQGMSGSPVYIDGKLLGAIGYGYSYTDHRIGLVTPADAMFTIYDRLPQTEDLKLPEEIAPLQTPVVTTGLNSRALKYLEDALAPFQIKTVPGISGASGNGGTIQFQPGSTVAVQLLRGDFEVASFGTVTHVQDDGRFIAFGHPFTHKGDVSFFASTADVHYTMPNLDFPYKIVSVGSAVGGVFQDRAVGIGGVLGQSPNYVPITITVRNGDENISHQYYVEAAAEASLMAPLVISSAYQGIDAALDRVGAGTSYVRLEFETASLSQRMIRENVFYSDSDIAVWSLTDLLDGLELLNNNNLQDVDLDHIQIDVEIVEERRTATIEKATPRVFRAAPGESVEVEVTIRPYRSELEKRILRIDIPADTAPGLMTVTVRSGGASYYISKPPVHTTFSSEIQEDDEEPSRTVITGAESLDKLVEQYIDREKNNEIVAEFYPFLDSYGGVEQFDDEEENGSSQVIPAFGWSNGTSEAQRARLTTQYVMEGMASFDVEIVAP